MTSSNGNIFRVTGPLCGEFTGPGEFPPQRPVTRSFDVFFDLRLNKLLGKQWWGWWFETLWRPLWRHRNAFYLPRQWMAYHCLLRENQTRTISGTEADYIQGSHGSIKFMMWEKTLRSNARDITKQFVISNNRMLQTCCMVRNVRENAGHVWSARANPLRRQDNLTTNMILTIQNERHLTFQKGWTLIKCKCMSKSGLY